MLTLQTTAFQSNDKLKPKINQKIKDNSTEMQIGGGAGLATFGALRNSSKIGNSVVKAIKTSKNVKADKQAKLLGLLSKVKPLAKYTNNPIVKNTAGCLAGLCAMTGFAGSMAKIADTCSFLTAQK